VPTQREYINPRAHLLDVEAKLDLDELRMVTIVVTGGEVFLAVEMDIAVIVLAAASGVVVVVGTTFGFRKAVYPAFRQYPS
jgi:pyruvate-formate lyase-activating enzyme